MQSDDQYIDRFYKKSINGKKGNLFQRVEWLEELVRNLQVRDTTNFITQIIQENKEIILSSVAGGTTDPTDPTFTGIVISPSGQVIGGVLYNFALVENGVVLTGLGDDGGTTIVVNESGLVDIMNTGGIFYLDATEKSFGPPPDQGFSLSHNPSGLVDGDIDLLIGDDDWYEFLRFYSSPLGARSLIGGFLGHILYLSANVDALIYLKLEYYIFNEAYSEYIPIYVYEKNDVELGTDPTAVRIWQEGDNDNEGYQGYPFYGDYIQETHRLCVAIFARSHDGEINLNLRFGTADHPSCIFVIPALPAISPEFGDMYGPGISTPQNVPVFGDETGKVLVDSGIGLSVLSQQGIYYLEDAIYGGGSDRLLNPNFQDLQAGSRTISATIGSWQQVASFTTNPLNLPKIVRGINNFELYLSSSVDQDVDIRVVLVWFDDSTSGTPAYICFPNPEVTGVSLTSTPSKITLQGSGYNTPLAIAPEDRIVLAVYVTVYTNADITLHFGDEDHPSFVSVPFNVLSQSSDFNLAEEVHGADEKMTVHDDDEVGGVDSENGLSLVKWAFSTIKAALETHFDTLYSAIGHSHGAPDASVVTYNPAITTNWDSSTDPGDIDNALDQLAERVADIESGSGTIVPAANANDIFRVDNTNGSAFVGTINGSPSGATLTYSVVSGNEDALVPVSTSQLAKLRLYNTTRGDHALISNCNTGTNQLIFTANVPSGWVHGDTITIASQTVTGSGQNYVDLEITSGEFLDKTLAYVWGVFYGASSGLFLRFHPFTAYSTSKSFYFTTQGAGVLSPFSTFIPIIDNVFSVVFPACNVFALREVAVKS